MEGVIMPAIRNLYHTTPEFKEFIDGIKVEDIHGLIDKIVKDAKQYADQNLDGDSLKELFGIDFCVFFLIAPSRVGFREALPAQLLPYFGSPGARRVHTYDVWLVRG